MSILTVFNFQSNDIRTFNESGIVWFSAADVCAVLHIKNHRDSLLHLDEDEKGVVSTDTLGGQQKISVVNESGLYALVLRSRKPEARKFAKWVTSEVLPAIRKTGGYSTTPVSREEILAQAMTGYGRWFMSAQDGKLSLKPIPDDAYVITAADFAKVIAEPGEIPLRLLPQIIEAAARRLREFHAFNSAKLEAA